MVFLISFITDKIVQKAAEVEPHYSVLNVANSWKGFLFPIQILRSDPTKAAQIRISADLPTMESSKGSTSTSQGSYLAIIGGSSLLHSSYFANLRQEIISTEYGEVLLHFGEGFLFCQRHQADPKHEYSPPHSINTKAIFKALSQCNVTKIIAFGSVGSLKRDYPPGTILLADDIFNLWNTITFFDYDSKKGHLAPYFDSDLRKQVLEVLKEAPGIQKLVEGGTYVQTIGPRFESKAEIRFLAQVGDVVGNFQEFMNWYTYLFLCRNDSCS